MIYIDKKGFESLCHQVRASARSDDEADLLRGLLIPLRNELGFDDPRDGVVPAGYTVKEALWNNIRHLFDHSFRRMPYFDLTETINSALLSKS